MQHSLKYYLTLTLFLSFFIKFCPAKRAYGRKIKITGNVIENTKQPLEYAQ
jgi:hypothetical protein